MTNYRLNFNNSMDRVRVSVLTEKNGRNAWEHADLTSMEAYFMARRLETYAEKIAENNEKRTE